MPTTLLRTVGLRGRPSHSSRATRATYFRETKMSRRIIRSATRALATLAFATLVGSAALIATESYWPRDIHAQDSPPLPTHQPPTTKEGGVVVMLCDGKTSMEVKGLKSGQTMSHQQALEVTRELMAKWQAQHPDQKWQIGEQTAQTDQSSQRVPAQ